MRKFLFLLLFSVFVQSQSYKGDLVSSMMGATFNPSTLSPTLFINPYKDDFVSTVDNNGTRQRGSIINSATATSGQALAGTSTLQTKPIYNGEGWFFSEGSQLTTGSTSDYNFIHDGSDFDIWVAVFICPTTSTTYQRAFICNNGFSTTARGILLRANSSNNNRLECNIGNGTASFITLTANSALTVNATNIIRIRRSGSNATMHVNGVQVATQTIALSPGVGNAGGVMTVATWAGATANLYFKDLVIFNRVLTSPEATSMNTRRFLSISPEPLNIYLFAGDSNCAGRGVNSSIAGDLTGNISGAFAETYTTSYDYTAWCGKLLLGTNQTIPSENPTTQHGSEMRFGKDMGATKDVFIIKYGVGSNTVFQRNDGGFADFNVNTTNSSYNRFKTAIIPQALYDIVHSLRRTPVFRGFIWVEGANDALFGAQGVSWTRSGTTATVTSTNHGLVTQSKLGFYGSSDLTAIPIANYQITKIDNNTFTMTVPNAGATSGTISFTGGYYYKQNVYDVVNGIIDYLTGTVKNQITNGTGYTVNKLRLYFPQTTQGIGAGLNTDSFNQTVAAQVSMGTDYLTDNPSKSSNVLGSYSETTSDLGMQDGVHYSTAGYDGLGTKEYNYFSPYVNE
jgi:hypothetical protein